MYRATEFSKYKHNLSHTCDCWWLPASLTHTTNHHDNNETDDDNSKKRTKNGNNNTTSTASTTSTTSNHGTTTSDSIMAQMTWLTLFGPFGDFFFLRVFLLILNNIYSYYGYIKATEGLRDWQEGKKRKTGPNDVNRIVLGY